MKRVEHLLEKLVDGQGRMQEQLAAILTAVVKLNAQEDHPADGNEWLTITETARFAGVSEKTIRRSIGKGQLPASNVRGSSRRPTWRIKHTDLEEFLKKNEAGNVLPASLPISDGKYRSRHFRDL
jgi:excisionase family DNA binding protein